MTDTYHVCRRARREDIQRAAHLWEKGRALYDPDVWAALPRLLGELMDRDLATFAIIEALPRGDPRLFGGISFLHPNYIAEGRASASTLSNYVMRAAMESRKPFLFPTEVAVANAEGELHLFSLFGDIEDIDLANPEAGDFYRTSNEGHRFFHFGYSFRDWWAEVIPGHHVYELQQLGMQIDRRLPLASGGEATLLRITREDALANPYRRFATFFFPPKPRFGFSRGEQRLLEYALLDHSDEDAADELHLSHDAVKKRWRSIYAKIDAADPELLSGSSMSRSRTRSRPRSAGRTRNGCPKSRPPSRSLLSVLPASTRPS